MKKILLFLLTTGLLTNLLAAPYSEIRKDVAYRPTDPMNTIDLYYPPQKAENYPTHIYIHGGGWTGGTKNIGGGIPKVLFEKLADKGFLGISVEYRKVNAEKNWYMRESTVDALDAIRYVVAHAKELNVDPNNLFIWGGSAGGHLTLMAATAIKNPKLSESPELATTHVSIRAAMALFPPCDMENYEKISVEKNKKLRPLSNRMGRTFEEDPEAYAEISPLTNLSTNCPPVLIFHGDNDHTVNMEHSVRFKAKADRIGADCTLQIVKNGGHGFGLNSQITPSAEDIMDRTVRFFTEHSQQPDSK